MWAALIHHQIKHKQKNTQSNNKDKQSGTWLWVFSTAFLLSAEFMNLQTQISDYLNQKW